MNLTHLSLPRVSIARTHKQKTHDLGSWASEKPEHSMADLPARILLPTRAATRTATRSRAVLRIRKLGSNHHLEIYRAPCTKSTANFLSNFRCVQFGEQCQRRRPMSRVVIIRVRIDVHAAPANHHAGVHPFLQLRTAIHDGLAPGLGLRLYPLAVAEPPDVGEVRGYQLELSFGPFPRIIHPLRHP